MNKLRQKGFTLIELLIVVALIGALAIALIATIDPFEQLKKGTDTSRRDASTELYNGMLRYYSVKGSFPWSSAMTGLAASNATVTGYLSSAVSVGELKSSFTNLSPTNMLGKIYLTSSADANGNYTNLTVCYLPESKSFQNDANTKYTSSGSAGSSCISSGSGSNSCYWCIQ